jgi:hypothetical protein
VRLDHLLSKEQQKNFLSAFPCVLFMWADSSVG